MCIEHVIQVKTLNKFGFFSDELVTMAYKLIEMGYVLYSVFSNLFFLLLWKKWAQVLYYLHISLECSPDT